MGLNLKDLGPLGDNAGAPLNRAQALVVSLAARKSPPRLLWTEKVDGKDSWFFHEPRENILIWVVDQAEKSLIRERQVGVEFIPAAAERDRLPADLPGFFQALARVTPHLSADAQELIRELPALRRSPAAMTAVVGLSEGKDDARRINVHIYDPIGKKLVQCAQVSVHAYRSLLDRKFALHAVAEQILFGRMLDDLGETPKNG